MANTNGLLHLDTFYNGQNTWASGMNKNMVSIDNEITRIHQDVTDRATEIEAAIAARTTEVLALVQSATADYTDDAETIKAAAVIELKSHIDSIITSYISQAVANQDSISSAVVSVQTRLTALEASVSTEFSRIEAIITSLYSNLDSDLDQKLADVQNMKDQLMDVLTNIAATVSTHIQDVDNPHRVTFLQAGGAAAVTYIADSERDSRYL